MTLIGARGREDALELYATHHVIKPTVAQLELAPRIELVKAGSEEDSAHIEVAVGRVQGVIHGLRRARRDTTVALGADPALQATLSLRQGLLLREAQ